MATIVSNELNYQPVGVSTGTYTYSKITPLTQFSYISGSGTSEAIFEISGGTNVFNLGKSVLSFDTVPTGVASANACVWEHISTPAYIRELQLYDRNGTFIATVPFTNKYVKMMNRLTTKKSDLESEDLIRNGENCFINDLHPTGISGITPTTTYTADNSYALRPTESEHSVSKPHDEAQYLVHGNTPANPSVGPNTNKQLKLSKIPFVGAFQDKDAYYGGTVYLRVIFAPSSEIMFSLTSASADTDTDPLVTGSTMASYSSNITVNNLTLFTAIEKDPEIVASIMNKYNSGTLTYMMDYPFLYKQQLTGATTHNLSVRFNTGLGQRLKYIFMSSFHDTEDKNTMFDHSVVDSTQSDTKIASLWTSINNERTTQYDLNILNGDHWMIYKDWFKGNAIGSNNDYYYNFVHIENLVGSGVALHENQHNVINGMPLDREVIWACQITQPSNQDVKYYVYGIIQRQISVSPAGIVLL